jgi:hypothetical protein
MVFNDTSTKNGIIQACEDYLGFDDGDISGNTVLLKRFTRLINDRYNLISNRIWKSAGDWEYDDRNQTTLPEATVDLVIGQKDYELPSTAQKLERVEVLDADGDYQIVYPFDKSEIKDIALSEYYETAGMPVRYDVIGRSLLLYPKPGSGYVTTSEGLKIYVSRDVIQFNSTATSTEPGFALNFHRLLPLGACIDYAVGKGMDSVAKNCIYLYNETLKDLEEFYARRHRDPINPRIKPNDEQCI